MIANRHRPLDLAVRLESWAQRLSAVIRQAFRELATIRHDLASVSQIVAMPGPVEHIGEVVRWMREGAGLSRVELAQETGIAASTIRNLEAGKHAPTRATLRRLQRALCMAPLTELAKSAGLSLRSATVQKRRCRGKEGEQ